MYIGLIIISCYAELAYTVYYYAHMQVLEMNSERGKPRGFLALNNIMPLSIIIHTQNIQDKTSTSNLGLRLFELG